MSVEVVELLQVAEDDPPLASKILGDVSPLQLWEVVLSNVAQRSHILSLCHQELLHDPLQLPAQTGNKGVKKSKQRK